MGASTVLTAELLTVMGFAVSSTLHTLLVGKTAAEGVDVLDVVLGYKAASAAIKANGVSRYSVDGQSVERDLDMFRAAREHLLRLKNTGGGPRSLPVVFGRSW